MTAHGSDIQIDSVETRHRCVHAASDLPSGSACMKYSDRRSLEMNGASVILPATFTSAANFSGAPHCQPGGVRLDAHTATAPSRSEAKYMVSPSAENAGENSARSELIGAGARRGSFHTPAEVARDVSQMSESWLSNDVDRLKYSIVPSGVGVGTLRTRPC